jgi:dihydrofolate reductase (trimethoprim resistance protein)
MNYPETHKKFKINQQVRKIKGAQWQGRIVGWYSTELTPEGYAVESDLHNGSVQIYPASALDAVESYGMSNYD